MPSLVIRLDPAKLARVKADVRYELPARLAERADGLLEEDGCDYEAQGAMQIYPRTSDLERALPVAVALLETERFDDELFAPAAEIGVSDADAIDTGEFRIVYPANCGALNFAVLDAGEATDAELEALWAKHARPQTARG